MKYIIEIEDEPLTNIHGNKVWKAKKFNSLVFDQNGLDKLEKQGDQEQPHIFLVGEEIQDSEGREAYVLVPNKEKDGNILGLVEGYACPQFLNPSRWTPVGHRNSILIDGIIKAYRLLEEEER